MMPSQERSLTRQPEIELLHLPQCPNVDAARSLLRACLSDMGLTSLEVADKAGDFPFHRSSSTGSMRWDNPR